MEVFTNQTIGIAGNARVGKDTICQALIETFRKYKIKAVRRSIAGDQVRKDLKCLISQKFDIDIKNPTNDEKELIRPIMVEYGRAIRKITNGRYFIEKFKSSEFVDIVPDIRYAEYENDEFQWLKNEKFGFLIYIERPEILPANIYEEKNNEIIKSGADYILSWETHDNEEGWKKSALIESEKIVRYWFSKLKL